MASLDIVWQDFELAKRELELEKQRRGEPCDQKYVFSDDIARIEIKNWRDLNEIKITNTPKKKKKKMQTQKYNLFPEKKSETTIRSIKFPHNRNDGQNLGVRPKLWEIVRS